MAILIRLIVFIVIDALMCLSYYGAVICYENGRPFVVSVIMISVSLTVAITISGLLWRT